MSLTRPVRLRPGDAVAVVAPSGPVDRERLARSLPVLESRYRVKIGGDVFERDGYLAGSDQRRVDELNGALRDPDVRAVVFARGGYGATRILADLDADALRDDPIPLVGFSDITAILGWAASAAGVPAATSPFRHATRTMPFSRAMPKSAMNPTEAGTDRLCPEIPRATTPPTRARGMLSRISAALLNEPKLP